MLRPVSDQLLSFGDSSEPDFFGEEPFPFVCSFSAATEFPFFGTGVSLGRGFSWAEFGEPSSVASEATCGSSKFNPRERNTIITTRGNKIRNRSCGECAPRQFHTR